VPLKSGSAIELTSAGSWKIPLPGLEGFLMLSGPARFQVERLRKYPFTGRTEGTFQLREGELFLTAAGQLPKLLQIKTPLLTVRVTGTQLVIGHRAGQGSRLIVMEGEVWAKPAGSEVGWRSLPAGIELTVTPKGQVHRRSFRGDGGDEWKMGDLRLPTGRDGSGRSEGGDPRSSVDLRRFLWHED